MKLSTSVDIRAHVAIALVSAAVLLFEILVTRVLSVTLAYHFAFLSVSLAMLGLGAPGIWLSIWPPGPKTLHRALLASAVLIPLSMLAIVHVGASMRGHMPFWIACVLLPLIALGSAICLLLLQAPGTSVGRMYAADLVGAAVGAVLVVPLLDGLPTPMVIAALGVLPLLAAVILSPTQRIAPALVLAGLGLSFAWAPSYQLQYTSHYIEEIKPMYERWTHTARVTVFKSQPRQEFHGWGVGTKWKGKSGEYHWLDQDGSAGTEILKYEPGEAYPDELLYDVTSLPYRLGKPKNACIIGGGGGRDILTALSAGVARVDVVELNPYIVDAVSNVFGSYSGDPYHLPGVHTYVGEGRNHFAHTERSCDVFQISLIDTFAATSAGAYALTENSLYTLEALHEFWSRLSADGVLSISRWSSGPGRLEAVRLALMASDMLKQVGVDPNAHLVIVGSASIANIMMFRRANDAERFRQLDLVNRTRGFYPIWPIPGAAPTSSIVTLSLRHGPNALTEAGLDVSSSTDDRPFFFQTLDLIRGSNALAEKGSSAREQSVSTLRRIVLMLAAIAFLVFFLPLAFRGKLPKIAGLGAATTYFAAIGIGFMFVEVPLLQRLTVYLGHPSYATTVVLGALLLGAGVGSMLASRLSPANARIAAYGVPVAIVALVIPLFGSVIGATMGFGLAGRVSVAGAFVFALGVVLGLPFALGMSSFDGRNRSWYWAVNGAAGVLASALSLALSMMVGFTQVVWLAVICYCVAALMYRRWKLT